MADINMINKNFAFILNNFKEIDKSFVSQAKFNEVINHKARLNCIEVKQLNQVIANLMDRIERLEEILGE